MAEEHEGLDVGLHENIDEETYHADLAVSQSQLKILRNRTPAHLKHSILNPKPPTPAMLLGSATHSSILTPDLFDAEYIKTIEGDGRKKEVKEARAWQAAEFPGCTPLKAEDYDACIAMRQAVLTHPDASVLLQCERKELTAVWEDEDTNLLCRGRFDAVSDDGVVIVDVKTTQDASKAAFTKSIYDYGIYIQAGHYLNGANANGLPASIFAVVAVESAPPNCVCVYEISGECIDAGRQELRRLLSIYNRAVETDEWPAYESPISISLPPWAWKQIEERVDDADEA